MKIVRLVNLLNLIFVATTAAQLAAGSPAPNPLYAAIWPGGENSAPVKDKALACYTNVIGLPGRIINATKHALKHMTFPRPAGQPVPRQLLCCVVLNEANGRESAEAALTILSDLYKTAGPVTTIEKLITRDITNQDLITAIDSLVTYANTIKTKLGFPEDYVYHDGTAPTWRDGIAVSAYETNLRSKVEVQKFIGAWRIKPEMNVHNIHHKMMIQRDYFNAVSSAHPEIVACFQHCVREILRSAFPKEGHITKIEPALRPVDLPTSTTLYRRFGAHVAGPPPQPGEYAVFAKDVSGAIRQVLPEHTVSLDAAVQAMTSNTKLAYIRVGIGHELSDAPPPHYKTDIRTLFVSA